MLGSILTDGFGLEVGTALTVGLPVGLEVGSPSMRGGSLSSSAQFSHGTNAM